MRIGNAWGSIRGILRNQFSFAQIKDIVGAAGLPVHEIAHLRQELGGSSKGQLVDNIEGLMMDLDEGDQDRFVTACIEEIIKCNDEVTDELERVMNRVGWGLSEAGPYPLRLQVDLETRDLADYVRDGLAKCIRRYRDGDFAGAISSVCGVVDQLTEDIYQSQSLANHKTDSYQQRVVLSFSVLENEFRRPFDESGLDAEKTNQMWQNYRGAVSHSAYVLGAFRREYADVHGVEDAPPELVQRALDCAVFLVRTITGLVRE